MNLNKRIPLIRYTIKKSQVMDFVNELHNIQLEMIERAVEKSELKDAKAVLERIMAK
jgi:hypothetical protein